MIYLSLIRLPPGAGGGFLEIAFSNQRLSADVPTRRLHFSRASNAVLIRTSSPLPVLPETVSSGTPLICASPSSSRSEEHTSELQSLMRISYAVFCLKKKHKTTNINN